jgi:flagellar basal body-associated protein FliL
MRAEGVDPSEAADGEAEQGREEPEKPEEVAELGGEEPEKPEELKKAGRIGEITSFIKERVLGKSVPPKIGGLLEKAKSFTKGRLPKKAWIVIGVGGVILLLASLSLFFNPKEPESEQSVRKIVKIVPRFHESVFPLSSFFVPISSGDQKERFVWIRIALQLDEGDEEAVISNLSGLRSAVFNLLGHKKVEDFRGFSGKDFLKTEIQKALNKRLDGVEVRGVFLVDLLIL